MSTDSERQSEFDRATDIVQQQQVNIVKNTWAEINAQLEAARRQIVDLLATGQLSEYDAWRLPELQKQIEAALAEVAVAMQAAVVDGLNDSWEAGIALVDEPFIAANAANLVATFGAIDTRQLEAMREFLTYKMTDITTDMTNRINSELGLVMIGAKNPAEVAGTIAAITNSERQRGITVVRTELGRAYSHATQKRMESAQEQIPELKKRWLRSGKFNPRAAHVAAHGQIRAVNKPFTINGHSLLYPRDPRAPTGETINCGCTSVPHMDSWANVPEDTQPEILPSLPADAADMTRQYNQAMLVNKNYRMQPVPSDFAHHRVTSPYVPHENTKSALEWARENNLATHIGFGKTFPVSVLNQFLQSVHEHLVEFPKLREMLGYIGDNKNFSNLNAAHGGINLPVKNYHAYAVITKSTFNPLTGIVINNLSKFGKNWGKRLEAENRHAVDTQFLSPGGTIKSIIDHEMGHMLDGLLNLRNDKFIVELYENFLKHDAAGSLLLSRYGRTDKKEFIAEAWREYRNSPAPRTIALAVAERIKTMYVEETEFPGRTEQRRKWREQKQKWREKERKRQEQLMLEKKMRDEIERLNAERQEYYRRRTEELNRRRMVEANADIDMIIDKIQRIQNEIYKNHRVLISISYTPDSID